MSIMDIYTATGTSFVHTNTIFLIGLSTLLLGCEIRLGSLWCIRWWTLATLISLRLLVPVTFPLVPFLGVRGIGHNLLSIHLTLWRRLLLWKRWSKHGGLGHWC